MYIYVENEIIMEVFCGDIPKKYSTNLDKIREVPDDSLVQSNTNIKWYDEKYNLRPVKQLIAEGLYKLNNDEKLVGNAIEKKTDIEMYKDGTKEIPEGYEILGDELKPKRSHAEIKITSLQMEQFKLEAELSETQYHVLIAFETGGEVFPKIAAQRAAARARITEIKAEIASLA